MSLNSGLIFKWLKSENTSSAESRRIATLTRKHLKMTSKQYRKMLSLGREKTKVLERIMSEGRWECIDFSKIPSRAGMIYRNAFARHDVERMKQAKEPVVSYEEFAKDKNAKVNAKALYPYEVVSKAMEFGDWGYYYNRSNKSHDLEDTERLMVNKYWENLEDFFKGCTFNGICVADTSGSMYSQPLSVALSIAMYCAEHNKGAFANHFFTFSDNPTFIEIQGADFVDKVNRMAGADWDGSTNIEAVFDKMLNIAKQNCCSQDEIPANVIIVSDMEFNSCVMSGRMGRNSYYSYSPYVQADETLFETIEKRWATAGYKMPNLVFWNCSARNNNIPMQVSGHVTYVSGFSPVLFEQILKGKTSFDLMMDKLNSERYEIIK